MVDKFDLIISKSNEVFLRIQCEPHIEYELRDYFKFDVPNAKFMPQYRGRNWNGEIHLFDMRSKQLYVGLLDKLISFCKNYNYNYKFEDNKFYGMPFEVNESISYEGVKDYMKSICSHSPRDYQIEGVYDALKHNRRLLISPTASGKSLMIYSLVRYYVDKAQKILLVVPTMLTQCHTKTVKGFMGQTTAFRKNQIKSNVLVLGENKGFNEARYIHGTFQKGFFSFFGGHDPEDYRHFVLDPPTDLNLHPNSPGYRLILNNILFPAAKKKQRKT